MRLWLEPVMMGAYGVAECVSIFKETTPPRSRSTALTGGCLMMPWDEQRPRVEILPEVQARLLQIAKVH